MKDLSSNFEWTNERWIITLSKVKGQISIKEERRNKKNETIKEIKKTKIYESILKKFPDAKLKDVVSKIESED